MKSSHFVLSLLIAVALILISVTAVAAKPKECAKYWSYSRSLEFPAGFWEAGSHSYDIHLLDPVNDVYFHREFESTPGAPLYPGQVQLRLYGLEPGRLTEINPAQDTVLQVSIFFSESREEVKAFRAAEIIEARWDGGEWVNLPAGPITKYCAWDNPGNLKRTWGPNFSK